ncbi:MAG: hypothetical protein JO360_14005, partial [Acidobacteria bacterium]|nr:hypothetical protein [Acidobacteriota bacterium]
LEAQVGAAPEEANGQHAGEADSEAGLPFSRASIEAHLTRLSDELKQLHLEHKRGAADALGEATERAATRLRALAQDFEKGARPNAEQLEESLTALEKLLDEALLASLSGAELAAARAETETQLSSYRGRMEEATYRQTFDHLLLKRLREQKGLPRLSLFYL